MCNQRIGAQKEGRLVKEIGKQISKEKCESRKSGSEFNYRTFGAKSAVSGTQFVREKKSRNGDMT